jgi:hypothetical protein
VQRWQLACISLVLGETEEWNDVYRQWCNKLPFNTWVDSLRYTCLAEPLLHMCLNESAEYPELDTENTLNQVLVAVPESNKSSFPHTPPSHKRFYCILCQVKLVISSGGLLYDSVCSSSRGCPVVCDSVSILSCNEICCINIRSIND